MKQGKSILGIGLLLALPLLLFMVQPMNTEITQNQEAPISSSIYSTQYAGIIDSDMALVNYSAPSFTWFEPIWVNFTVDSNVSDTLFVTVYHNNTFVPVLEAYNVTSGLNYINISLDVLIGATPGDKNLTITLRHLSSELVFGHVVWVGSGIIFTIVLLSVGVIVAIAIIMRYGSLASSPSSSTSFSTAVTPIGDVDEEDDTSTVTYVDQSRAPAGRIFCPECKKVIEEGSIFCPECGTRIPRYLRYHP